MFPIALMNQLLRQEKDEARLSGVCRVAFEESLEFHFRAGLPIG